jgi:ketosteroid isomerase-like protein
MVKRLVPALLVAAALGGLAVSPASAGESRSGSPAQRTAARTHAFLAALEREDLRTVAAMTDERATLTVALSFSGAQEPAGRFVGREQVLGYVRGVFTNMAVVDFTDERVSVTGDGNTSFVQANGRFTAADGRPYDNVYVFRYDWHDGRIVGVEEYANPVTFCTTFGHPDC